MKILIWAGLFGGSIIGGYVPMLWGADVFSIQGVIGSAIGSILGIWLGYKIGKEYL